MKSLLRRSRLGIALLAFIVVVAAAGAISASAEDQGAGRSGEGSSAGGRGSHAPIAPADRSHRGRAKRGKRGKQGQRGPSGPAGPAGPPGAPGPAGISIPLLFKAQSPTPSTPIFAAAGLLINGACSGSNTELTGVSQLNGSIFRATDVVTGAAERDNAMAVNQKILLTPGGAENNYVLTYLAGDGRSIITSNYGIANGGMELFNVACAAFGTIQVAVG